MLLELFENNRDKINWLYLGYNPNAIQLIENNIQLYADKTQLHHTSRMGALYTNINALHLIQCDPVVMSPYYIMQLSFNPEAIHLLEPIFEKYGICDCIGYICRNPSAMHLIEKYPEKIRWDDLSTNPSAMNLLLANPDKIDWNQLSRNPAAIHLLEANPEKIKWLYLSENPSAMHLLEANPEKINWFTLSKNPAAIEMILANPDKIHWDSIWANPAIFEVGGSYI